MRVPPEEVSVHLGSYLGGELGQTPRETAARQSLVDPTLANFLHRAKEQVRS